MDFIPNPHAQATGIDGFYVHQIWCNGTTANSSENNLVKRVPFLVDEYDIPAEMLLVDTGVHIGAMDRESLEAMASAVAAHNENGTGTAAALVNLDSREKPNWVVRALTHRPLSAMGDGQLELTIMSNAAMVSKAVADLLGRPAPGVQAR